MSNRTQRLKLDAYFREVEAVVLAKQNPVSGLLPASTAVTVHGNYKDAWVRDNVYSILAVWGLALAYRRVDDDEGRGYELERRTVQLMRGLLRSMMAQVDKVERFKHTRHVGDALHAKYDTQTGQAVVGDSEWGHLQIDATSLYLLMLAQMISSGLDIIWTLNEVAFVQNLVYYIERAYRTPDYGIWERGDKQNSGSVELNASSLGMAKAALEALSKFDLFGARGSQRSVVHVIPDNIAQANITLASMLPRESNTKETDAALLSIIGFPAFAVQDAELRERVRSEIMTKLKGRYGFKRFLRDGHQTVLEDVHRLHYEPKELKQFENIESEWPLFYVYVYLDHLFRRELSEADECGAALEKLLVERDGQRLLPELYYVAASGIEAEKERPGSQDRLPNENVPLVWAQSLYLLGRMIRDGLLSRSAVDPLARRRGKIPTAPVVQILLLAEDAALQAELAAHGVATQTVEDIAPVRVFLSEQITAALAQVGRNEQLGLTGRASRALKTLTTSRFYMLAGDTVVSLASFFTHQEFFLPYDLEFLVRRFRGELTYLHRNWTQPGRPTVAVLLTRDLLEPDRASFYTLMQQLANGRVDDVPVRCGRMTELLPTAAFERIDELYDLSLPADALAMLDARPSVLPPPGDQMPLASSMELSIDTESNSELLLARLAETDNLYEQVELIGRLVRINSSDLRVLVGGRERSLFELTEEVYVKAGRLRLWPVIRYAAGLLGKVDGDLTLAVGAILVRQKTIQIGRTHNDQSLISQPIPEHDLLDKIRQFCLDDIRDGVLTQEILLFLGLLIKERPELFGEVLTLRVGHIILLLSSQLARERGIQPDAAYEVLMTFAPSTIERRLEALLEQYQAVESLPQEQEQLHADESANTLRWKDDLGLKQMPQPVDGWFSWRQHQGIIDRRSASFYSGVWNIFHHTPGIIVGDRLERRNRMQSSVVLSDMTSGEKAFALWLDHVLSKLPTPEYRHVNTEALSVLASFFRQNPTLRVQEDIALDALVGHAIRFCYLERNPELEADYEDHANSAWQAFYAASPARVARSIVFALRILLDAPWAAPSVRPPPLV